MTNPLTAIAGTASAAGYLGLNATFRIIEALVKKGVLSGGEAGDLLLSIVDDLRDDAMASAAEVPSEAYIVWLEQEAAKFRK